MNKEAHSRQKPDEHFIKRVKGVKSTLKGTNWKAIFLIRNPEWNNLTDLSYLNRVYLCRTADIYVTEELEAIALELHPKYTDNV
ncbi:hypothetical protein HMF3257_20685 [Spirosoma telluris]|uniref:Uncharacterized protein n=1 Tax=Spirosoma telluris TaxID=2183553 RepID=A0A327NKT3_9BACT|nr:hypothetical protein HMF3257_20685 [Spirosoma telluris]